MAAGGATWLTAGTLTLGTGNTFAAADVTEVGSGFPYNRVWWTYFAPSDGVLTIDTYLTDIEPAAPGVNGDTVLLAYTQLGEPADGTLNSPFVYYAKNDDDSGTVFSRMVMPVTAGTMYHILASTYSPDEGIITYRLRASLHQTVTRTTAWLTTLRDRDDNQIIVSSESNTRNENPWPEWRTDPGWYSTVLNGEVSQRALGRRGHYNIQGDLPGWTSLLSGADACAWAHAVNGDQSAGNTFWNTSTDDPDDSGPPTCRPLGENPVEELSVDQPYRVLQFTPWAPFLAGAMYAEVRHSTLTPAFRFVEANVHERGALPLYLVDPAADGVPAEYVDSATFEWEPGGVELVSIEASGDANGADIDPADAVTFLINPTGAPAHTGGGTYSAWPKGIPTSADSIHYEDGLDWNTLPFSSFDDVAADGPDMVVVAALDVALDDAPPDFREVYGVGKLTYRFTFRSPRYRWTWVEELTAVNVPVRKVPRSDGYGYESATRSLASIPAERHIGGDWD